MQKIAKLLAERYMAFEPLPLVSRLMGGLTLKDAYRIQAAFVGELMGAGYEIAGYKAGLTSRPTQKNFGASGAVSGVLFEAGRVPSGGSIDFTRFGKMLLEVELGYIIRRDVLRPTSPRRVKGLVAQVVGVVEVADLNLEDMNSVTVADIVATNIGSRSYVVGEPVEVERVSVSQISGQLFKDSSAVGRPINSRAALGGQWKALAWTINNVLAHGWQVRKGMLIITGALGSPSLGAPGFYEAHYSGGLGEVRFRVR